MLKKMSLTVKLILSFMITALITSAIGVVSIIQVNRLDAQIKVLAEKSIPSIVDLEVLKVSMLQIRVVLRTFMTSYLPKEEYEKQMANVEAARKAYKASLSNYQFSPKTKEETNYYDKLMPLLNDAVKANNEYFEVAKGFTDAASDKNALSLKLYDSGMNGKVRDTFLAAFSAMDELLQYVKTQYGDRVVKESEEIGRMSIVIMIGMGSGGVVVGMLLGILLAFSITRPVNRFTNDLFSSSDSLESAAGQVSASGQELSSGASELASSVEEMTSSLEELQSIIESNTKNITEARSMIGEAYRGSQEASGQVQDMTKAMGDIEDNSRQIQRIIKVIDDIAFQTNILALNAAVEAARAGDAGRGFAVVADQVKSLAQKSADAAKETALLIEKAMNSVNNGIKNSQRVKDTSDKSGEALGKANVLAEEVARGSQEQLKGAMQVTKAISQINTVVQQTASTSEESAAAGEELLSQSEMLKSVVIDLTTLVKGHSSQIEDMRRKVEDKSRAARKTTLIEKGAKKPEERKSSLQLSHKGGEVEIIKPDDKIPMNDFKDF